MREQFDTIYNSMVNGQRRQALEQCQTMGLDMMPELIDYLTDDLNQPEIALDLVKSYFRIITR